MLKALERDIFGMPSCFEQHHKNPNREKRKLSLIIQKKLTKNNLIPKQLQKARH
jgi:hypothetical protein